MAMSDKRRGRWWSRLHFGVRFIGLTGLLLVIVGLALALLDGLLTMEAIRLNWELLQDGVRQVSGGEGVGQWPHYGLLLLGAGLVAGLFSLFIEILVVTRMVAGRRSALGFNSFVQIALATVLLIGVNLWSAGCDIDLSSIGLGQLHSAPHFARLDTTRHGDFTLPPALLDDLRQLQGDTTIIVYDRNRPFGKSPERQDAKDQAIQNAAERVVVEKLKDLMEQFREQGVRYREFGARFKVEVLDVDDENIEARLSQLTEDLATQMVGPTEVAAKAAELRKTIEDVPENSIFIVSGGQVQRLSFNDFYYLDKKASRADDNLVLLYQGAEPLARKIMNVDEKKPVVGVLVVHELLTTQSPYDELSLAGVKKTLEGRGFEIRDIILKNWGGGGEPQPAVYTYDESKYEVLQGKLSIVNEDIRDLEASAAGLGKGVKLWKESTLAQLTAAYRDQLQGRQVTEELRKTQLAFLERNQVLTDVSLTQSKQERDEYLAEMAKLSVDRLDEQRRITDLKYKLDRELAECDLIIVPRISLVNVNIPFAIPYEVHLLQDAQVAAIKDYLKDGKPALFCFGPSSEAASQFRPPSRGSDGLDDMLGQLGFVLNRQTILFDNERRSFGEQRGGMTIVTESADPPPPLQVDWPADAKLLSAKLGDMPPALASNPVRQALQIAAQSMGQQGLDLRLRHPRPIGFDPAKLKNLPYDPVFLASDSRSWSENNPFPSRDSIPRQDPTDDAMANDPSAERDGPFAVGLAVEEPVPPAWYSGGGGDKTVRVALLGYGHMFVDNTPDQSLAKETLLLTLSNWLLGRDDLLPRDTQPWSYPRVALNWSGDDADDATRQSESDRWLNIGRLLAFGLPFLFVYAGMVVFLMRRIR